MITKDQIKKLSEYFQIDGFSVFREYLQLMFLSYLYQEKRASNILFKGGTCIRLLFNSPRFSEDLDFSTVYSEDEIKNVLNDLKKKISKELIGLEIKKLYSGKEGVRFRLIYKLEDFKYPFVIRLDFHKVESLPKKQISTLMTKFPILIFPQVYHLSEQEIFKEKMTAVLTRNKGRDIFDIWFLLSKRIKLKKINKKFLNRIEDFSQIKLRTDLEKFLPKEQRGIVPNLKKEILRLGNL